MDIRKRIEVVIEEKELTKKIVSERMGKFNQAFNSLLTNPKWSTIEQVAEAIGVSTQELLFGAAPEVQKEAPADSLPFSRESKPQKRATAELAQAIVCPKCGCPIGITVKAQEK